MAQVLAVPGDVRHGFSFIGQFNHDFGRITGIAATIKGNILLCDYDKKNLILVDPLGHYLNKLDVDSEPYDVAITSQNIGYITQPYSRCVLQIDPDRMVLLFKATCNDLNTSVSCVSAFQTTGKYSSACFLGVNKDGCLYSGAVDHEQISSSITDISTNGCKIGSPIVKFHTVGNTHLSCTGGQNHINCYEIGRQQENISIIDTMDSPTDICSDDNGHIYVSGQGSNNIHRLEDASKKLKDIPRKSGQVMNYRRFYVKPDWKVLDIPLDSRHGIQEPVALCFNHEYSKLYIVNDWGKSVLVFGVI